MISTLPSKKQLEFMDWEFGVFFHFGIRTFYEGHKDWDEKPMDKSVFNPAELDCEQWIKTAKSAGAKYAVFTAKHHDGFANWNSKYTEYSVENTPFSGRDIVEEFIQACRKHGLKVGIYYSPAQFGSRAADSYDDYFINQISELLTNYGRIDYLWFDGCGSEGHEYDTERIVTAIRTMQPDILIFNMWDPDTRWVGNEDGYAPEDNFNEVSSLDFSVMTDKKDELEEKKFLPAECDCRIRKNWFYRTADADTLKSVDILMDMYEKSVGHGANLLLNLGPDRRGLIPEDEVRRMAEFGERICREYGSPASEFEGMTADVSKIKALSKIVLQEDMTKGQIVRSFKILLDGKEIYSGSTIGHKRICKFEPTEGGVVSIKTDSAANIKGSIY